MISMNLGTLARIVGGELRRTDQADRQFDGVCIDSRQIGSGQLFVALKGQRVDGHRYVVSAFEHGASAAMVEADSDYTATVAESCPLIAVRDSYAAMIILAKWYRDSVSATRVGITGSNGKTTTKEIAYTLLNAARRNVFRSPGNLNNLYGAPLAIFAMPADTEFAVLEMGVSVPGEMAKLADIVRPNIVAITNVGATHLEFLGSIEGVVREKLSLMDGAGADTKLIVNADDPVLLRSAEKLNRQLITFAINQPANIRPEKITYRPDATSQVFIDGHCFNLNLFGAHQVYNLLTAYAIARAAGVSFDGVDTESIHFTSSPLRGEFLVSHGVSFIVDCYNANPGSVQAGLTSFVSYKTSGRRIVILGDMLELGESSAEYHRQMGIQAADRGSDVAVFVGTLSHEAYKSAMATGRSSKSTFHYPDARSCTRETAAMFQEGDIVYVKGSRGIGLETVVEPWRVPEGVR